MKNKIILFFLIFLGLSLRLVGQPTYPHGFHRDEAGIAYSAYSILKTGRDEWGVFMPLHFKALGDYPPGIYNYLTAISMIFFGPTEFSERFPAIFFGTLLVLVSYIFVKEYFNEQKIAIVVAFIIAVSPWDIVQSRSGSEPIVALLFSLLVWIFYKKWINASNKKSLALMLIFYFLSIYTYNATRLFLPLFQLGLLIYFWNNINKKFKIREIAILVLLTLFSFGTVFLSSSSSMRFKEVSVFSESRNKISFDAYYFREGINNIPIILSRIFHNKLTGITLGVAGNYLYYFNATFLFFEGGFPARYRIPSMGLIYLVFLPFILMSILFKNKMNKNALILIYFWILLAPLVAAITVEDIPHVKRSMYLFLPLYILIANGILMSYDYIKKKKIKYFVMLSFIFMFIWNFGYFLNQYFIHSKYETINHRSYGYKQAFDSLFSHESKYNKIIVFENNDTPYTYYLFYSQFDPVEYQKISKNNPINLFSEKKTEWNIGKYYFHPGSCPDKTEIVFGQLYLTKAECASELKNFINILDTIYLPDGISKFIVFDQNPSITNK